MAEAQTAPRYQQVAQAISDRIEGGEYPVGHTLPTEKQICAEFGVSRYTAREALRRLTELGLVQRRQGSGTQVIASRQTPNYAQKMRSLNELFEFAQETRLSILGTRVATVEPGLAELLGRRPDRQWLIVDAVRRDPIDRALNYSRIYVHEDFAGLADGLEDLAGPLYKAIEDRFGILVQEVIQTIAAEPFPRDVAKALAVRPGGWAVSVTRRYLGDDSRPILISMNWHPAETFSYAMHLKRDEGV